jgi:hypothetical protein
MSLYVRGPRVSIERQDGGSWPEADVRRAGLAAMKTLKRTRAGPEREL